MTFKQDEINGYTITTRLCRVPRLGGHYVVEVDGTEERFETVRDALKRHQQLIELLSWG